MVPLAFLSGVFHAAEALTEPWRGLSRLNPLAHMVEGLRGALTGWTPTDPGAGWLVVLGAIAVLGALAWHRLAFSPKLRP